MSGDTDRLKVEVYAGWMGWSVSELFSKVWLLQEEYFFSMDAALMIASKGGLSLQALMKIGIRTKDKYLQHLKNILKQMNSVGDSNSNTVNMDTSSGEIDIEAFNKSLHG